MRAILGFGFSCLFAIAACGGDSIECTAMGCMDGLGVSLANPPPESYRVEATPPGQPTQTQTCASGGSCFIFFDRFMPSQVSILVVLTASGMTWGSAVATPNYNPVFANGPDCGVTCRRGFVNVAAVP